MSLSKNIPRCSQCICMSKRQYATRNPIHERSTSVDNEKLLESASKDMPTNHWKLLNQLKDFVTKTPINKGLLFVLNNEWAKVLQKIPSLQNQLKKQDTSTISQSLQKVTTKESSPQELANVLEGPNKKQNEIRITDSSQEVLPKWKSFNKAMSKPSLRSRTKHVIASISAAESELSRHKRLEDLTNHLNQYPEAKHLVIKEGGIGTLLRLRAQTRDENTLATVREALSILGYVDPPPGRGIRILSIDGGGIRGVVVIEMLKKLEELTGKSVYELFDFVCGVSTGAILACVVGAQRKPLDEVSTLYKELSTEIFTQNPIWGTSSLVWSHSYYSTELWEKLLKNYIGDTQLIKTSRSPNCPKIAVVSAIVNQPRVQAFIFRNYSLPYGIISQYTGGYKHTLWEAVRASAAAPSYFEEFKLGEYLHQDGGILVNNPCAVAVHEARHLWPGSPIQCIISFGTGRCQPVIGIQEESLSSSWKTKFLKILDSATDTEAVHTMLNDLLPGNVYYRFNPYLTEMVSMAEINPAKIAQLEMDAEMYFRRNEETFQEAAKALMAAKTFGQWCQDWINLKRELLGIK
ncbi:calcium-independent phospholipase A2-gamma-like isoform X1 [Schistocerca cancellata]|uniref:calcium-independent phospholipase A2-gamma-like isoform X1 n=2 Tax=Schistocerca cancellata TaxID=274614 RepID=UPI0021196162|nr:calcium-independent phospholipase A2-gamma-like isoform X1 [Schistocerca cancellata]XP_049778629.1 calcium-independent phospholipase A2-gamma-like isoform X1 [Schistocerca cancellata]